jgi:uncharacterized membrane protein YesL
MNLFSADGKARGSLLFVIDTIYLGLLWLICCLPIVTMGPACTAMYYATVKVLRRGRGNVDKAFFSAFRANFKQSFMLWLIFLGLILLWLCNLYILFSQGREVLSSLPAYLILLLLLPLVWVFAYISRFENRLVDALKFSVYLSVKNLGRSIMLCLTTAAFAVLAWMFPALIPLLPGFCCLAMSFQTEPVFKAITEQLDNDSNEDKWYNE